MADAWFRGWASLSRRNQILIILTMGHPGTEGCDRCVFDCFQAV